MHDPNIDIEKQAQFEKDGAAYNGLTRGQQRLARGLAAAGFACRRGIVGVVGAVIGTVETVFHVVFVLPYIGLARLVTAVSNGVVKGMQLGVRALARGVGGVLAFGKSEKAEALRKKVLVWEKETVAKIDRLWRTTKENLVHTAKKTGKFMEYYGALGIYRATNWILYPRTPSGKPLFINKTANKVIGSIAAGCVFIAAASALGKLAVMVKMAQWHFLQAGLKSTAPWYITLAQQAAFHPPVTAGLWTVKFCTLPVIAASRQALKSTALMQGVAYQYNARLRAQAEKKPDENSPIIKQPTRSFVGKIIAHIIEKASPEFYRARLKHYQQVQAAGLDPCFVPPLRTGSLGKRALEETFNGARQGAPAASRTAVPPPPPVPDNM